VASSARLARALARCTPIRVSKPGEAMLMHLRNSEKQRRRHRRITRADRRPTASGLVDALRVPETT